MKERTAEQRQLRKDNYRASHIRTRVKEGRVVPDIDRAWLAKYEDASAARGARRVGKPEVEPKLILRAVCAEYHVTLADLRKKNRARQPIEVARAVAIVALSLTGCTVEAAGKELGRKFKAAHHMLRLARLRPRIEDHARAALVTARGAGAGDIVMVPIVVGSAAWKYIDSLDELDEITAGTIRHRDLMNLSAMQVGAE